MAPVTVYPARMIRTMNPAMPTADTVVVQDGRILEVGTEDSIRPTLSGRQFEIDDRFRDAVLLPGFVDPHLHPGMASLVLPMAWITGMEWQLPGGPSEAVLGQNAYLSRLAEVESQLPAGEPLFTWGYHQLWHGNVDRTALNKISSTRPIIAWHRGFHSLFLNDAAIDWSKMDRVEAAKHPQIDLERGFFFETGREYLLLRFRDYLFNPARIRAGYETFKDIVHANGITTFGDMAFGRFGGEATEWSLATDVFDNDRTPFRVQFTTTGLPHYGAPQDLQSRLTSIKETYKQKTGRLSFGNSIKFFADGGFFSALMQLQWPGQLDGAHGHWITTPEVIREAAELYWDAGYVLHVHTSGDLGLEMVLDILEHLQARRPRFGRKFVIEHFGVSTPEQVERMAAFGANASVNAYYVHELGDRYWEGIIGHERASQMSRLGTLVRNGIRFGLHSDFIAAPAQPLLNAWIAANRLSESGRILAPHEKVSVEQALRAITIDAAYILGLENEIGSIRAGKKADFAVLAEDPFESPPENLRNIRVLGTVFEGVPFMR